MINTNQKIACVYVPTSKYNLEDAKAFLLTYKYKVKNFETSDGYYKFRQLTSQTLKKHGFIDYTAKEINNTGIVLIIVSRNLDGGDFTNYIREKYNQTKDFIVSGSGKFSSKVKAILDKHGRDQIHSITIVRTPINSVIKYALETVSWKKIQYDKFNCLYDNKSAYQFRFRRGIIRLSSSAYNNKSVYTKCINSNGRTEVFHIFCL